MAASGKGQQLTGLLIAWRRRRRYGGANPLVAQRVGDATPAAIDDWLFDAATSGAYTLTAQGGTYALTGGTATIKRDRALTASGGSYAIAGQQATITWSSVAAAYTLTAQGGSYAITGASASLNRNRRLTSSGGAYALTGQSITLRKSKRIVSTGGAYTYTGATAILERDRRLTAMGGAYGVTGGAATVTYTPAAGAYVLTAQGGSYSISGGGASIQVSSSGQADTHDGYFHKLWRKLKEQPQESSIDAIAQRIDAIEDQIAEVQARPLPAKPIYIQSVPMPPIEAQAKLIEALIVESARLRRELQDEEDAEILLFL